MLIEFSVKNFKSINDQVQLSLVADAGRELGDTNVTPVTIGRARPIGLLRSAAIYGANAAGKTNLIKALETMQQIVLRSASELDALPVTPFRFDLQRENQPTTFEVQCLAEGIRYQYGFSAAAQSVVEEWLYAWPNGRLQTWFERSASGEFKFGDKLLGDKKVWRRATRSNALLLSTAITLNSAQLQPLFDWFKNRLRVAVNDGWTNSFSVECCAGQRKDQVVSFLHQAGLAVSDIRLAEEDFLSNMMLGDMPPDVREAMTKELSGAKIIKPLMSHRAANDRVVEFDLADESDGTQKVFALSGLWIDALENGRVIAFDELHGHFASRPGTAPR